MHTTNDPRVNARFSAPGILTRWRERLPVTDATPLLSLGEGATPLVRAPRLADWVGVDELWLKFEGANPTGSFKDRGMVLAVAKAVEDGAHTVLCASTGNTSASAAAYAAAASVRAVVLLPADKVAAGKLAQAIAYGARIGSIRGSFDDALALARVASEWDGIALVNSINPFRIEGQTTGAYEVVEALGDAPDVLALPVGNGGNITAWGLGFRRELDAGRVTSLPVVIGGQAEGAAPFVHGSPVDRPETIATAIRIGRPATWEPAIEVVRETGGAFRAVPDAEILDAWRAIPRLSGVFCEPASAAGVAALRQAVRAGRIDPGTQCVCVLTGNGMKDPDTAAAAMTAERLEVRDERDLDVLFSPDA
jgi:threonine synthase